MPRLIVNADDFGLTSGVNRAIFEMHQAGVLTSATLMARASATDEAIAIARATSSLGVGCHIVLVDGEPALPPYSVSSLIDKHTGGFPTKLTTFVRRLFCGRIRSVDMEAEARAQIQSLQARGIQPTHIDTHKHTHMFPPVLRPILRAARSCGIQRIRNPFEPEWAVRVTPRASLLRNAEVFALRRFGPYFRRILAEEGFATTDGTIAVAGTGVVNADTVRALLRQLPPGTWEFVTHPGYNDADLAKVHTRLRESREIERVALQAIREFPALEMISFAGLSQKSSN